MGLGIAVALRGFASQAGAGARPYYLGLIPDHFLLISGGSFLLFLTAGPPSSRRGRRRRPAPKRAASHTGSILSRKGSTVALIYENCPRFLNFMTDFGLRKSTSKSPARKAWGPGARGGTGGRGC